MTPPPLPPNWPPLAPPPPPVGWPRPVMAVSQVPAAPPPPRSRHFRAILIFVAIVALLAAAGGGSLLWIRHANVARREARVADELFKNLNANTAGGAAPIAESDRDDMIGIALFMDDVRRALNGTSADQITRQVDARRILRACQHERFIGSFTSAEMDSSADGLAKAIATDHIKSKSLTWDHHEIRRIRFLPADDGSTSEREAVVSMNLVKANGSRVIIRYWVRGSGRSWRWYDYELLDGTRYTLLYGHNYAAQEKTGAWVGRISKWDDLHDAWLNGNWDKLDAADAALAKDDPDDPITGADNQSAGRASASEAFPPQLQANALLIRGERRRTRGQARDAKRMLDAAEKLFPDLPRLYISRARACIDLDQNDQALADARHYRDEYATTAYIHGIIGDALLGLGRLPEAAAEYRLCLDGFPDEAGALVGLARSIPAGNKSELAGRFALSHKPDDVFSTATNDLDNANDVEALEILAAAEKARRPDDVWADFYTARALTYHEKWKEAAALFETILNKAPTEQAAASFARNYLTACVEAGDPIRAYHKLPERKDAFETVASRLLWPKSAARARLLRELVAVRKSENPAEPWLDYYLGQAAETDGRLDLADVDYSRGLRLKLDADTATRYRTTQVYERCRAGKALQAYQDESRDPEIAKATFLQVAAYLRDGKHADEMERLLALFSQQWPDSPLVPMWQAEVQYERRAYDSAEILLNSKRQAILIEKEQKFWFYDRLIRCLVQLGRLDDATNEAVADAQSDPTDTASADTPAGTVPPIRPTPQPYPMYALMIAAARGDAVQAASAFEKCLDDDTSADDLYADPEVGPALKAPAFAALRAKFPPSATTKPAE